jgi:transposase
LNPLVEKGIGAVFAASIVAEIGDFSRFENADKLLAYAGLEPGEYQSGESESKGKMTKHGSRYLRETLMNAVLPIVHCNAIFADYFHKKRNEGKSYLAAKSHTAKKLLRIIFTLHKNNVMFDSHKLR